MALQAHQFLIHADLVRIDRHFLHDPAVLDHCVADQLSDFFIQTLSVIGYDLRRLLRNEIYVALHFVKLADQVISEELAFSHAGLKEILSRFTDHAAKGLPERFRVHRFLFHSKDVREAGK